MPPVSAAPVVWNKLVGTVIGVTDGDTITVLDEDKEQHKIRLEGIDAPESKQASEAQRVIEALRLEAEQQRQSARYYAGPDIGKPIILP
jgi:endonuclease YncB( thermonuclease family)